MSYNYGIRVQYKHMKTLGTVIQGNEEETLVCFDDGDKCAVDTVFLTEVTA